MVFKDNTSITIPLNKIKQGIRETEDLLKQIDNNNIIQTQIKFMRYKGSYFKDLVKSNNIKQIILMYCTVCGSKVIFKFKKDHIDVINKCYCGNTNIPIKSMTYDEFAVWYASQIDGIFKKYLDKQLFKTKEI